MFWSFPRVLKYDHLPIVGRMIRKEQPLPVFGADKRLPSPFLKSLSTEEVSYYQGLAEEYRGVAQTLPRVRTSIKKMDCDVNKSFREDPSYMKAVELVSQRLQVVLTQPMSTDEEVKDDMEMDKAAAYTFIDGEKLSKKHEFYNHPKWKQATEERTSCVWRIKAKENEWKSLTELSEGSMRTFIMPPVNLLHNQKRLFMKQNEALKNFFWSYYGFIPFHGNVNRLAEKLKSFPYRACLDWRGYDRLLAVMEEVYYIRRQHIVGLDHDLFDWVHENTVRSFLADEQGYVFFKNHGNNSGSGNTTTDNIIAAMIIWVYLMIKAQPDTTLSDLDEVLFCLFGDDELHGVTERYKLLCDESFIVKHSAPLSLRVKYMKGGLNFPLEKLDFLGFTFSHKHLGYVPSYDAPKLLNAMLWVKEKNVNHVAFVQRAFSCMLLSFGHSLHAEIASLYLSILAFYARSENKEIQSFVSRGYNIGGLVAFYFGFEGGGGIKSLKCQLTY